ncbi:hypothetical protein NEMIN01_0180 [Nematocida minor]|uniref:uncharacterized protein n=1 Tax=Nematocida minor TaxID=1912983 RepID=UPI00221EEDC9|nr:uncharacterized protein NEMIN01_0076 [Nematocida minor]XP_051332082.1 uncharacterized protein NEMIN01_0180 [Nematocida minor]KAI5188812.1 hypothetical protein NEMIN01_0076 [Nematocida minor]KAI5188916.1 hypothetical protein NEMIN01_0180 [Nematocida minor]
MFTRRSLKELKKFLLAQPCAFYNYPDLLHDIKQRYWEYEDETETQLNTQRNSKYKYCRILYEMYAKKRKKNTVEEEHRPSSVQFLEEVRDIEDHLPAPKKNKKRKTAPRVPKTTSPNDLEKDIKKETVYVSCKIPETRTSVFRYFEEKNVPEKELT